VVLLQAPLQPAHPCSHAGTSPSAPFAMRRCLLDVPKKARPQLDSTSMRSLIAAGARLKFVVGPNSGRSPAKPLSTPGEAPVMTARSIIAGGWLEHLRHPFIPFAMAGRSIGDCCSEQRPQPIIASAVAARSNGGGWLEHPRRSIGASMVVVGRNGGRR
jgi:hypothetical protein